MRDSVEANDDRTEKIDMEELDWITGEMVVK
jgi:hypothetical protein